MNVGDDGLAGFWCKLALMWMRACRPPPSWWPGGSPPIYPDRTDGSVPGSRSGGRQAPRRSRGSRPTCGARGRDSSPRAWCRRSRRHRCPYCPPSIARSPRPSAAPIRCRPPRTGAATVGGAAGFCKAHGKEKTGDLPPFGPMRALPRDGVDTARPHVVVSPPAASGEAPAQVSVAAVTPEFGESCNAGAYMFTAARGFGARSLSACSRSQNRFRGKVEKTAILRSRTELLSAFYDVRIHRNGPAMPSHEHLINRPGERRRGTRTDPRDRRR